MGSVKNQMRCRHGELDIVRLEASPDVAGWNEELPDDAQRVIVGHSESGACHVIVSNKARLYRKAGQEIAYLVLPESAPLRHDGQRHETKVLPAGTYGISIKRQFRPDGSWSPVID
jgi:hypothetical protein